MVFLRVDKTKSLFVLKFNICNSISDAKTNEIQEIELATESGGIKLNKSNAKPRHSSQSETKGWSSLHRHQTL